jgi:hypothetical protein
LATLRARSKRKRKCQQRTEAKQRSVTTCPHAA